MNHEQELDFIRQQLKRALPPSGDSELQKDLWPQMLRRLDEQPATFGWFESILLAFVALAFAIFPKLLPAILYQL